MKNSKKNDNKKKRNPIVPIILVVILYCVIAVTMCFVMNKSINLTLLFKTIKTPLVYIVFGGVIGIVALYTLVNWSLAEKKSVMKENDLSNSHFMTRKEIRKSNAFEITNISSLSTLNDGIPFRAEVTRNKTDIIYLKKPIHGVVLGTTGSGKTTGYLDPTIQIMALFKSKPSLIVTDPKGELCRHHKEYLENNGYTVSVIDYRNPYQSTKINPFQPIIDRILKLRVPIENERGKYSFFGETYQTYNEAEKAKEVCKQQLLDEIYDNMQDLIYTLFPIRDGKEPGWEEGARNLIFGLCLLFVDDIIAEELPIEKLCLLNVYQNIIKHCNEDMDVLKAYFSAHSDNIRANGLAKTVLVTSERTLTSYLSKVMNYVSFLADSGLQCMTSGNEVSFGDFDEKPNAVFLVYPDEKDNRHVLVSLFVVQTYKMLVDKATKNLKNGETADANLKRNVYFLLDEFGNLPKIEKFDKMTSVGRSRRMFFLCVLQSYSQLHSVYGKEKAEIIKGQLQIKIFLGTDDKKSVEEFSWLCGKKKIYSLSASVGLNKDASDTYSAKEQPLITTEELMTLNNADSFGNAIISYLGYPPLKSIFTPAYKANHIYTIGSEFNNTKEIEIFDESKFVFDIVDTLTGELDSFEDVILSADEIRAMEDERDEIEREGALIRERNIRKNGLLNSIRNKLYFIRDFIPSELFRIIEHGNTDEQIKAIDNFLNKYDGLKTVEYDLCFIKSMLNRLKKLEESVSI